MGLRVHDRSNALHLAERVTDAVPSAPDATPWPELVTRTRAGLDELAAFVRQLAP
jgi:hypothetical protein